MINRDDDNKTIDHSPDRPAVDGTANDGRDQSGDQPTDVIPPANSFVTDADSPSDLRSLPTIPLGDVRLPKPEATIDFAQAGPSTLKIPSPTDVDTTDGLESSPAPGKVNEVLASGPSVDGYEILGVLGRGAMGVVYKARQVKLNRLVALKMLLAGAHAGPSQLARFSTEGEAVARLQHPNIVQIYEVGEHDGLPYFSLEYADGGSLSQKIAGNPQPPREAAQIVEQLALAMSVAHDRNIIHRDLKPANVLLTMDGLPKITDFGLAKRLEDDSSQTKSGTLMGTPSYMPPEQARGSASEMGPLADLYSLGAVLYELLTGRPPFRGTTIIETLEQVRTQEPVPPTRLQPKCPRDLETITLKCLQKEPHKRYANCEALAADLHHFLNGEPIQARPVGHIERSWRWCRRNPRVAALTAAVAVLLVAVLGSSTVIGVRHSREQDAIAATEKVAVQRKEQATEAIAGGNYQRAQDLLRWSDPLLSGSADLQEVRSDLETLKAQVDVYAAFKQQLDSARFACWFGSRKQQEEGRRSCHELVGLYDKIEGRTGRGLGGLPPLNELQMQLFKEDVFELFLMAGLIERDLAANGGDAAERKAAQQALDWFDRAEQVVPGTRTLRNRRAQCFAQLGDAVAESKNIEQAKAITPTSAVDHFWHAFANQQRGDEALGRKDVKAAPDLFRKAIAGYAAFLQLRPDNFWGYFNWASCHFKLNDRPDLVDAQIGYTACMRLRTDFAWPYNNRGAVHLRLGEHDLAVADFTAALARYQHYSEAHANRGLAYLALDKTDLALADFNQAIVLKPDYADAYRGRGETFSKRKQFADAVRDFTRLLDLSEDKAPVHEKRAAVYRALGQAEDAIKDYGQVIAKNPKNLDARAARAELFLGRGRYPEARDELTHILEAAPKAAVIWRARGILNWQNLKEFDAALFDLEQFAKLAPKNAEAPRCIGVILLGRRAYDPALVALQKALDNQPGYPEAVWAVAQIRLWQDKPEEALKLLDPLVAKLPAGPPETLNVRASIYQALGRPEEAEADYLRMIELKPKEPEAYVSLARVYDKQSHPEKATACLDRLVAAVPESEWAYMRRAEHRRDHKKFDDALADCDQAARINPDSALPLLVRASIEAARGKPTEAVAEAERALKKAPPHDGHVLYTAACVWSLASRAAGPDEAPRYADRAAALLAEALDRGFHDLLYPEHNRMPDDPALAPIRQHPRVRDLLSRKPAG